MKFNLSKIQGNIREMAELFLNIQGQACTEDGAEGGISITWIPSTADMLKVEFDGQNLNLYGSQEVHFYRGLHLFLQKGPEDGMAPFVQEEKICFTETGWMIDCSRNGTIQKSMIKDFILLCAASGINQLYLYMEDVYEIPEDPYFGAYRGKYTLEDLAELDAYGQKAGVELIPAIQTLAHLHTYLRWPKTKKLQDTEDILLVGSKDTEELVRRMIHSVSRPFTSKKIHVGMDEADLLGLGRYLRDNGYEERYGIMARHLDMVYRLCKEEGRKPMIWSDMFFRLKSPTGDYYDLPADAEFNLPSQLPEDLDLVYWDYYHHKQEIYDKNIRLHHKLTDQVRFAGGGWTWNGVAPNYRKAERTLKEGMNSCRQHGIDKVMCTFWFDNGTETPVRAAFYSALYFAQLCYHKEAKTEELDAWLEQLTGYNRKAYGLLDAFDSPKGVLPENENADNPSKYLLYQDVLAGLFDGQIQNTELNVYYKTLAARLETLLAEEKETKTGIEMKEVFSYYKTLAEVLAEKSMIGVEVRRAYQSGQNEELALLSDRLEGCILKVSELKEKRESLWFAECRPFGFEVLDIRIGGVMVRLESAMKRIRAYLSGKTDRLEELEEQMLPYQEDLKNKDHTFCPGGFWQNMVSAGNIAGI